MAMIPQQQPPAIPARYLRVITLLREKPRTVAELASILGMHTKTVRTYISDIAKLVDVYAQGNYRHTKYFIQDP